MNDPTVDILTTRKEAQMLADLLPESLERFQLHQRIWACDSALDLLHGKQREIEPALAMPKADTND